MAACGHVTHRLVPGPVAVDSVELAGGQEPGLVHEGIGSSRPMCSN